MSNALYLLLGAMFGGVMNVVVQLYLRRVERQRDRRLAARVLIGELAEIASAKINTSSGKYDSRPLHDAWRQHRAGLTDLGGKAWQSVDDAVMELVYPEHFPPGKPSSNPLPDLMDKALIVLECHADLPTQLRHYG